jgi:hypothetical protein
MIRENKCMGILFNGFPRELAMKILRILLITAWITAFIAPAAFAGDEAILSLSGNISKSNQPDKKTYVFSFADLSKLPSNVIHTKTPWTAESDFTGPTMLDILKAVGANPNAKEVEVKTLDNYPVTLPISDFAKWNVILAHSQNGKRLKPSTKGPLWVLYPLDQYKAELDNNVTRSKLAWAVKGFIVH